MRCRSSRRYTTLACDHSLRPPPSAGTARDSPDPIIGTGYDAAASTLRSRSQAGLAVGGFHIRRRAGPAARVPRDGRRGSHLLSTVPGFPLAPPVGHRHRARAPRGHRALLPPSALSVLPRRPSRADGRQLARGPDRPDRHRISDDGARSPARGAACRGRSCPTSARRWRQAARTSNSSAPSS